MRDDGEGLEGTMVEEREEKFRHKRDVTVLLGGAKGEREERWKVAMKGVQQCVFLAFLPSFRNSSRRGRR